MGEVMAEFATTEMRERTEELLDAVGKLRAIGVSSRRHHEGDGRPTPAAAIWISPVPMSLTMQKIREILERYGKISYVRRRAHAVGVGADALVQFTQPAHATCALKAVTDMMVLGQGVKATRVSELSPWRRLQPRRERRYERGHARGRSAYV